MKRFLCWLLGHRLLRIDRAYQGELEKLYCRRCKRHFAMHHPTQYFDVWDMMDEHHLKDWKEHMLQ